MEIVYLMAGKRFKANDIRDLNNQLQEYNLVINSNDICQGVRKISDAQKTFRYLAQQSHGDPADFSGYDVVIGKKIANNGYGQPDITSVGLSDLEEKLNEVKQDIPDAKIVLGSYWS